MQYEGYIGAQWLSCEALDYDSNASYLETHRRHGVVSFSKTLYPLPSAGWENVRICFDTTEQLLTGTY